MFFGKKVEIDSGVSALFSVPTPAIATVSEQPESLEVTPDLLSTQLMSKKGPERDARKPRHKAEENLQLEKDKKSLFVGNVPVTVQSDKKLLREFKTLFTQFGKIESIRFRSIALAQPMNRRKGIITRQLHPSRPNFNAYIVYVETPSQPPCILEFATHHLLIDSCIPTPLDMALSIFIGNLPFDVTEEELFDFFKISGEIQRIRVIRDKKNNVGKGIAYVQYKERSSIQLSMKLKDTDFKERKLRIERGKEMKKEPAKERTSGHIAKKGDLPNLKNVKIDKPAVKKARHVKRN